MSSSSSTTNALETTPPQRPSLLRMLSRSGRGPAPAEGEEADVRLADLPTPAFVINRHAFTNNCQRVLDLAKERQLHLRPHVKTHKTLEGVQLQAMGTGSHSMNLITGFVASTLPEVKLLVNYYTRRHSSSSHSHSSGSILYGIPLSETKLPALFALQERLEIWHQNPTTSADTPPSPSNTKATQIVLLLDHMEQIEMVKRFMAEKQQPKQIEIQQFPVMVKLDTGYHRAGTTCDQGGVELVDAIAKAPFLNFVGIYSHCGHAYDEEDASKLDAITQTDMDQIQSFLQLLEDHWDDAQKQQNLASDFTISVGSTPSLLHHWNPTSLEKNNSQPQQWWKDFFQRYPKAILEIHPGNYTLYDRQQLYTKACPNVESIAGRVLTRVIGHYNDKHRPNTILMDAGATALTKETTPQGGMAALCIAGQAQEHTTATVYKLTQEVSMARGTNDSNDDTPQSLLQECPLGSLLTLLPNHSCLAAACFEKYYIIDDPTGQFAPDTPIVEEWEPVKGW